ncbi:MAG: type restriction enzyme subunit [Kosmotogales bacterium]|nr:type restriction enzyme subunit [Kosmotogales bacterium]
MVVISGGTPKTKVTNYWNGNIPWLSVKDFKDVQRYVYISEKKITKLGFEKSSTNYLYKGDTIISARGSVGEIAQIPYRMSFNQSCYGLRSTKDVDCNFFFYLIKNTVPKLKNITHGSVFDTITKDSFKKIEVKIPENKLTQKKIAKILSDLDDKIEVNEKINKKLEEMAQAIFKHWFIDFEYPVILDYECETDEELKSELMKYGYKSFGGLPAPEKGKTFVYVLKKNDGSYITGITDFLLKEYNELKKENPKIEKFIYWEKFNSEEEAKKKAEYLRTEEGKNRLEELKTNPKSQKGKMKESKLGKIPEKWEVSKLNELTTLIKRGITPRYDEKGKFIIINQRCIRNNKIFLLNSRRSSKGPNHEKKLCYGDVLINSTGVGTLGRLAQFFMKNEDYTVDSHVTILRPNAKVDFLYFGLAIQNKEEHFKHLAIGTTGQTELGRSAISNLSLLKPRQKIQKDFSNSIFNLKRKIQKNLKENENLSKIRDTLLPKLMSGELSVENLDIDISEGGEEND